MMMMNSISISIGWTFNRSFMDTLVRDLENRSFRSTTQLSDSWEII